MEEPELIKMLKYILLFASLFVTIQCHPLVTEETPIAPVPIHHSGEESVVPSLISDNNHKVSVSGSFQKDEKDSSGREVRNVEMSPVVSIGDVHHDISATGGQKRTRQIYDESRSSAPNDELCSIFQFFLESRRFSRCRVSNTYSDDHGDERQISNEVSPSSESPDNFQSENRLVENERRVLHDDPAEMDTERMRPRAHTASKRYDNLDELLHTGPPPPEDHLVVPPPGPPPMYPKSSLDRTTIIVPDRPCPRGERRDHKGYCRRIVRVRPNYQYGPPPPPPPYGPSRPIRYYYSRFVSVPTLQFFIPAVP